MGFSNSLIAALSLTLVAVPATVGHGAHIVDQEAAPAPIGAYSIDHGGDIGQSFTPTLSGLDFFVFNIEWSLGPSNSYFVQIHDGLGAAGTVLGTSQTVALPVNLPPTNIEFDFNNTVTLIPGNLYTALVVPTNGGAGDSNYLIHYGVDVYPGGVAFQVSPVSDIDMIFQEGVSITPEPSTLALAAFGFIGLAAWRLRRNHCPKNLTTRRRPVTFRSSRMRRACPDSMSQTDRPFALADCFARHFR